MAEFQVAGGVVVDIASGDDVKTNTDRLVDELRGGRDAKPLYQTKWAAQQTPAAGPSTTLLRFGRPSSGRLWNLVYLTITGADDRTAVAGALAASYVGNPDEPTLMGLIDPGGSVPNSASFSKDEIWVHDSEELFVVVYAAPNSQQLAGVARILEYPAEAREGRN